MPFNYLKSIQDNTEDWNSIAKAASRALMLRAEYMANQQKQAPAQGTPGAGASVSGAARSRLGYSNPGLAKPTGNVAGWINQALKILNLDSSYAPGIARMIQHESGGNPNAINKWDSNWKAGHPSMGLMQTIGSTFKGNALPGYDKNVYDPVSNIIAGVRYARNRYGDEMVKAGGRRNSQGKYIGY